MSLDATWHLPLRGIDREQASLFLRFFAAISVAFCVLWQASLYLDAVLENGRQRAAMAEATRHGRDLLASELRTFAADLRIIARGSALQRLVQGQPAARAQAEADFRAFVTEKPATAQLRYLDRSGQEVVRVDRRGDDVVVLSGDALQNKASRYYFTESIGLPAGRIYVSRIDLNVENGVVEEPWRPMLRLVLPLHDAGGAAAGIVILNINAAEFIEDLQRARPLGSIPLQLVNAGGYWLGGVERDRLFGFMFDREVTLASAAPRAWSVMSQQQSGEIEEAGSIYLFDKLDPATFLDAARAAAGGSQPGQAGVPVSWKIVGVVPAPSLVAAWRLDRLPVALVAVVVIAGISLAWSGAAVARKRADRERRRTEGELVRVERLASLGGLVAGVAHELNTPIGNAVAVASTLNEESEGFAAGLQSGQISRSRLESLTVQLREGTAMMLRDLQRAARLIGNFKQIAVDQTSEQRRRFRIEDMIEDIAGSLQPRFKNSPVTLETRISTRAELDSYAGPLSQVLLNLVVNAQVHGFDGGRSGCITVTARDLSPQEIELVVADDGRGIPRDYLKRIFEPFFTTRLGEGGSGLGLSIAFNIVTNILGGTFQVESRENAGTRMILRLPVVAPVGAGSQMESIYDV